MSKPVVGIDLGGTKIYAGVVGADGKVLGDARVLTQADRSTEAVLGNMQRAVAEALGAAGLKLDDVAAVGIGSPAPLDMKKGLIISPANLPSLHGVYIVDVLSKAFGRPVVLNNDANCYGLAEARFGAGAGASVCCGFTLGTGFGCFAVFDGRVYNGPHGAGTEIWCSPYLSDHVEERCCGRGVARNYKKLTTREATAAQIAEMARAGDPNAREAWREFGRHLAVPLSFLCNILDPDVVVLGGSMSKAWDLFEETMHEEADKYINAVTLAAVRIVRGALGDSAGMLGAAALVLDAGS